MGGGGTNTDAGYGIAVSGTSVYVTGAITNGLADANAVRFGGTGTTAGTVQQNGASTSAGNDLVIAKYTDNGTTATLNWTQVGGGIGNDFGQSIAVSGVRVHMGGSVTPAATFLAQTVAAPVGTSTIVLASLADAPVPTLTSPSTTGGPIGTSVPLTGTNFTGATAVSFNGTAATSFTVNSATSITATVPTGATVAGFGIGNPLIGSSQVFFVRVSAGKTSGSLTLNNANRVTTYAQQAPVRRGAADTRPQLQLMLAGTNDPIDVRLFTDSACYLPALSCDFLNLAFSPLP
ncbi:hypothetical protein [Hymenobacter daeguensis]